MSSNIEMFNTHQQDTRSRTDSLVKAIFLLSGGALTVSIGLFLQKSRVPLTDTTTTVIQVSWWFLFATILFGVLTLYTTIMRDYFFGERWRKNIQGDSAIDASNTPGLTERLILAFGNLGVLCFITGMGLLAYVATVAVAGT
ncbi:MAG: hypothetical protein P1U54_04180 [Immundisolibacteraceae bacterium]|nr:hypothetical protein [Immundisolibacteraceae bacterium]